MKIRPFYENTIYENEKIVIRFYYTVKVQWK